MLHTMEPVLSISEYLAAVDRAAGTANGAGIDLTGRFGVLHFLISVGTVAAGGTVDASIEESADNSAWSAVSPAQAITQITAAGSAELTVQVKSVKKRYARLKLVTAVAACTSAVALVAKPTKAE